MRTIMIAAAIMAGIGWTTPVFAQFGSLQCGLRPLPPLGCRYENARCVCDASGNCQWVFDCGN